MAKEVHLVRHQKGHVNTEVAFASAPTEAQIEAVLAHDDEIYGKCDDDWRSHPARVMAVRLVEDESAPFPADS